MRLLLIFALVAVTSTNPDYLFLNNLLADCEAKAWSQAAGYDCVIIEKIGNEIKITTSKNSEIERFTVGPDQDLGYDLRTKLKELPGKADAEKPGPPLPTEVKLDE